MTRRHLAAIALAVTMAIFLDMSRSLAVANPAADVSQDLPTRVEFPSFDGKTTLTGYLFEPPAAMPASWLRSS